MSCTVSHTGYVKVKETPKVNAIRVHVSYEKASHERGICLELWPVRHDDGAGLNSFSFILADPAYKSETIALVPLKRANHQLISDYVGEVASDVTRRSGVHWDRITAFAASRGLEILPPEA